MKQLLILSLLLIGYTTINAQFASSAITTQQSFIPQQYSDFVARRSAATDPVPDDYKPLYLHVYQQLFIQKGRDLVTPLIYSLDRLRVEATYSKPAALSDMLSSTNASITNDHGSSFTINQGLKGDGTAFLVDCGFNPSTAGNRYSQNLAQWGYIALEDVAANVHEVSLLSSGGSGSSAISRNISGSSYDVLGSVNGVVVSATTPTNLSSRSWFSTSRGTSGQIRQYINGFCVATLSSNSASLVNRNYKEFAADVNGTISAWSNKSHAAIWFGNNNVEPNQIIQILNDKFIFPLGNSTSSVHNRIGFFGDSMTGDETNTNTGLSLISEYPRRTLSDLGSDWVGHQNGDANREMIGTNLVPSLNSILNEQVIGGGNTSQLAFRNRSFTKDVICIWIGTNDLAFNNVSTATTYYNALKTFCASVKAEGFRIILVGIVARDGGYLNSQNTTQFNLANADYRTKMSADFNVVTSVTNAYGPAVGITYADVWIDVYADANFQNASNLTYYQADKIHLTTTGFQYLADTYTYPVAANVITANP